MKEQEFVRCMDCLMIERIEHAQELKHVCHTITDPKYVVVEDMDLKLGKKRFLKIRVKK